MKLKSVTCRDCDTRLENPTEALVGLVWNQCGRKNCCMSGITNLRVDPAETLIKYQDQTVAWMFDNKQQTITMFYEEPTGAAIKGKFKVPKTSAVS